MLLTNDSATPKKERNLLMDYLKGFAILLVILGHSIQYNEPVFFDKNVLFRFIYSFHMPLFMFVSGFLAFSTFKATGNSLMKRFRSLVIPFFTWFIISYFVHRTSGSFFQAFIDLLLYPDTGLWFLWILFLNFLLLFIAKKCTEKIPEGIMVVFIITINALLILKVKNGTMGLLGWHLPFFTLGYIFRKYKEILNENQIKVIGLISLVIFCLSVPFWMRENQSFHFPMVNLGINKLISLAYKYIVPISGIFTIYYLFSYMKSGNMVSRSLIYFGQISLEIYAVHFYFLMLIPLLMFMPFTIRVVLIFLIALTGSMLVKMLIEKSAVLSFILFGKTIEKKGLKAI
jgi:fucose 4-O-acetylase-like acetyltransferase